MTIAVVAVVGHRARVAALELAYVRAVQLGPIHRRRHCSGKSYHDLWYDALPWQATHTCSSWRAAAAPGSGRRPASSAPSSSSPCSTAARPCSAPPSARVQGVVPPERILVVTAADQVDEVRRTAPSVPPENIVVEPKARNTAPCIGLGALEVLRRDPAGLLAVLPSDQWIRDAVGFRAAVERALDVARGGAIVTIGIRPAHPETGFGYLELGDRAPSAAPAWSSASSRSPICATAAALRRRRALPVELGHVLLRRQAARSRRCARTCPSCGEILRRHRAASRSAPRELYPAGAVDLDRLRRHGEAAARRRLRASPATSAGTTWARGARSASCGRATAPATRSRRRTRSPSTRAATSWSATARRVIAAVGVEDLVVVATADAVLVMPQDRGRRRCATGRAETRWKDSRARGNAIELTSVIDRWRRPMNPRVFREYDIRGDADRDLDDDFVTDLGRAIGTHLARAGARRITLGRDCRVHSPRLHEALRARLLVDGRATSSTSASSPRRCSTSRVFHLDADGGVHDHRQPQPARGQRLQDPARQDAPSTAPRSRSCASSIEARDFDDRAGAWPASTATSTRRLHRHGGVEASSSARAASRSSSTPATAWAASPRAAAASGSAST